MDELLALEQDLESHLEGPLGYVYAGRGDEITDEGRMLSPSIRLAGQLEQSRCAGRIVALQRAEREERHSFGQPVLIPIAMRWCARCRDPPVPPGGRREGSARSPGGARGARTRALEPRAWLSSIAAPQPAMAASISPE